MQKSVLISFDGPSFDAYIFDAVDRAIKLNQQTVNAHRPPSEVAPILSAKQVKEMTGWPNGTFYAKVAQMPDGVVIRGKSKRLLFDRELFVQWLKNPVQL